MTDSDNRQPEAAGGSSRVDKVFFGAFLTALLLLTFMAGVIASAAGVFPGPQVARAYEGGRALYTKLTAYSDVYATDLWYPHRGGGSGVTLADSERMQPGATLFTTGEPSTAYLIDAQGEVLHRWHRPFSEIWDEDAPIANPQPDSHVYFRNAVLEPNGNLIVVVEGAGDTPYGYAITKLDRDSEVLWTYFGRAHHDLDVGPDGRIYAVTHEILQEPLEGFGNLADAWLEDYLVVLSPEGEEELKLPLTEMVARSPYAHLIHTVPSYSVGDPLHTNTVNLVSEEAAAALPFAEAGQVMMSFRELNAIGLVDVERQELVWAARGPWLGQHYPTVLENGNVLLFDNYGNYDVAEGISRIIEFDPTTMEIVWEYGGTPEQPFHSAIRSEQQRLTNGNTLITESNGGRIFEVTPEGDIVWEYLNPARGRPEGDEEAPEQIAIVNGAQRISAEQLDPDFLALAPVPALAPNSDPDPEESS